MDPSPPLHLGQRDGAPFLLPSGALTRHVVCLGATGSGKTALCLALLEEVALQGLPVIALDPKGDVANLLLTFPGLPPERLAPWLDEQTVRKHGGDRGQAAVHEAARWREGLASSGVPLDRIAALRERAELALYTPGSDAGLPLALVGDLGPPPGPREAWPEQARSAALALLTLAGVEAEAGRSREEVLLSALLLRAWDAGEPTALTALLGAIQRPPFARLGALDLEVYYPQAERFELVLALNHLLATRAELLEGTPLDIDELLGLRGQKPRISVLSMAHLGDSERRAFATALLGRLVGWLQRQPGRSSPRALLFLDEAAGYLPPVANPPTKGPLLTLVKQGRAQGLGVVVATQNPADLDYKALSNAGTWLVGRLATGRDRQRVKEALEGSDLGLDDGDLDGRLAALSPRHFLCHGHWTRPLVFEARWPLSYLRGPLLLDELRSLRPLASPAETPRLLVGSTGSPLTPPGIKQLFLLNAPEGGQYAPRALALLRVGYQDRPHAVDATFDLCLAAVIPPGEAPLDWSQAERLDLRGEDLTEVPPPGALFEPIPPGALRRGSLRDWQRALLGHLAQHEVRRWWWCPAVRVLSEDGEEEAAFRRRLEGAARAAVEEEVRALRAVQEPRERAAEERLRRAEQALERRKEQATRAAADAAMAAGAALLGGLLGGRPGRKVVKVVQGATRTRHASNEAERAGETVESNKEELGRLRGEHAAQQAAARARLRPEVIPLERVELRPARGRVEVLYLGLGWLPGGVGPGG